MSTVSETIVREYFEQHGFLVRQDRKFTARGKVEMDGIDFFVLNPQPRPAGRPAPFLLTTDDLPAVNRAVVVVRGWHTESFGPSRLEHSPEMFRFVEPAVFQQAARSFSPDAAPMKILIVPALPQTAVSRGQSIALLRAKGVDAVIPFRTILADLVARTEINRNYDKSDLLQIIRVLKTYDLCKDPQLELFRRPRRAKRAAKS
jgi:hypothetical protein